MTDIEAPPASKPLPPGAVVAAGDLVEAAGHPVGSGDIKPGYDPRLTNEDLAPLHRQNWSSYNIFAFWMSDVHSVGGYVTMGALFAIGLTAWQVFACLIVGICIVQFFVNLVAKPSQQAGLARRARHPSHRVAIGDQQPDQPGADNTACPGDEDPHGTPA